MDESRTAKIGGFILAFSDSTRLFKIFDLILLNYLIKEIMTFVMSMIVGVLSILMNISILDMSARCNNSAELSFVFTQFPIENV